MRRKALIVLLALGTVGGFGSGIMSMRSWRGCHNERRAAFEEHVAKVCVDAARKDDAAAAAAKPQAGTYGNAPVIVQVNPPAAQAPAAAPAPVPAAPVQNPQ